MISLFLHKDSYPLKLLIFILALPLLVLLTIVGAILAAFSKDEQ